jgi:hypothetical protein
MDKPILAQPIDPILVDTITNIFIFVDLQIKINLEIIEFEKKNSRNFTMSIRKVW